MTVLNTICRLTRIGRVRPMHAALCAAAIAVCTYHSAHAQTVGGAVHVEMSQGFVRILVHLSEEVESEVNVAGGIVVVHFKRPVEVGIETLAHSAPNVVGAARRDPDGRGFRIALSRKAIVNSMAAGERLYIDLLPDTWKGLAPGLPKEVIEELSRRARLAERSIRTQRDLAKRDDMTARVRVATQPTFTRYVFELPEVIPVTADRGANDITLKFAARLKFDFGDLKASLPSTVKAVESFDQGDSAAVRFALNGKADIRTFREDKNYVLDVGSSDAKEAVAPSRPDDVSQFVSEAAKRTGALAGAEPPQTIAAAAPQSTRREPMPSQPIAAAPVAESKSVAAAAAAVTAPRTAEASVAADINRQTSAQPMPDKPVTVAAPALGVAPGDGASAVTAEISRQADSVRLTFPFRTPTPAAIFQRAGTLWMVFDTRGPVALPDFGASSAGMIRHASGAALPDGYVVRLMLDRPRLVAATAEAGNWTVTVGDNIANPSAPLSVDRTLANAARPSIAIPLEQARELHRIADPEMGDSLLVVTAHGPARGFIKPQEFVEFRTLASTHGVAVQPLADDVQVELAPDNVIVARPGGLTLSGPGAAARSASTQRSMVFDPQLWGFDRQSDITERQYKLIAAAADMSETKRNAPRLELARFFLSRDMYPEAKGVLDVALSEERPTADDPSGLVLRAITTLMLNRPEDALKELNHPMLGDQLDAPLWRAFAHARLGKWEEAGRGFKNAQALDRHAAGGTAANRAEGSIARGDRTARLRDRAESVQRIPDHRSGGWHAAGVVGSAGPPCAGSRQDLRGAAQFPSGRGFRRPAGRRAGAIAQSVAALRNRRPEARRSDHRARDTHHGLARRRHRNRGSAEAGAALYGRAALPRCLLCDALGAQGAIPTRRSAAASRMRLRPRSTRCSWPERAMPCPRSRRSACSTISAN